MSAEVSSDQAPAGFTSLQPPRLTEQQQQLVHQAACRLVAAEVTKRPAALPDATLAGAAGLTVMGAFVTLKRRQRLRGCCGSLGQPMTLLDALNAAAARTATGDVRLPPASRTELPYLDLSVSLLHSFLPVKAQGRDRAGAVETGTHGLHIARGDKSGLLLPVVAVENELGAEEFLRQVCRKAGLPSTAWEDDAARIVTFQVLHVDGPFDRQVCDEFGVETRDLLADGELARLTAHCRQNLLAHVRGATPSYYLSDVADANVPGVILSLHHPQRESPAQFVKFSMRPGVPLQASLFALTEAAAASLRAERVSSESLREARVGVTVLYDTAMHGTLSEPDLAGFDPRRRALLVSEGNKSAWVFDPTKSPGELLQQAEADARRSAPEASSVFSLAVQTTEPSIALNTAARPQSNLRVRPAAVAGAFYPADAGDLERLVNDCFSPDPPQAEGWPALMLPHAGLVYSGRIAAQTLERVAIPETVLVIGPKHTRLGVDWAVTPHETWSLPGGDMHCDAALARRLSSGIPGLELDAAAHQNEHAVEVELPLIRRLAPRAKVVGIAIGAGDLARCRGFAQALAKVLRDEAAMPLLVISSDMNHFATDAENRRLDELALAALESLDAAALFETVMRHQISMCGVLPAVIVMETLRKLGRLTRCRRVAYGTSADVSGDKSRVVGYAGLLLG
jgi:AmmeMemoRadiSam system protein B/AmmeMemoRadiSam system protein A